jgi:hypothetical protein
LLDDELDDELREELLPILFNPVKLIQPIRVDVESRASNEDEKLLLFIIVSKSNELIGSENVDSESKFSLNISIKI